MKIHNIIALIGAGLHLLALAGAETETVSALLLFGAAVVAVFEDEMTG